MVRTRLRQVEQIGNSLAYDDNLNMGPGAEAQAGDTIASATVAAFVVSSSDNPSNGLANNVYTIVVRGNVALYGINANDQIVITGSSSNNGTYTVVSAIYESASVNSFNFDHTKIIVQEQLIQDLQVSAYAILKVDPNKNLRRDLDFIRTQLRKLNRTTNWYDDPLIDEIANATLQYKSISDENIQAGTSIDLIQTFRAGAPYLLAVYVNGQLLMPSVVDADNEIVITNDYTEYKADGTTPATTGETGRFIKVHFNILNSDIIQFKWVKL